MCLEFGECQLDWIEVGAVSGQEQVPTTSPSQCFSGTGALVRRGVIQDDNSAGFEFGSQLRFDVSVKCVAVHGPGDDPRGNQGVLLLPSDERLCLHFPNFRFERMDKKSNSSSLQIVDLTARPIENHYLHATGQRSQTDQRAIEVLLEKIHFCSGETCEIDKYDVFPKGL